MSTLPATTVKAIWGIDLPYGRNVAETLKALGVTAGDHHGSRITSERCPQREQMV
jgi:hypothetical protein